MQKALVLAVTLALASPSYAADLWQIYQQAEQNDASYQQARATYAAAQEDEPIARGGLLPTLQLSGNSTLNDNTGNPRYNSNGYTLALSQPLFNFGNWKTYSQSQVNVKMAAITFAQAQQTLVMNVAKGYFAVLADQDNLRYAEANEASLKQNLAQVDQRYKVGLAAMSDVQYARSQYEQAKASSVQAENQLADDLESLAVLTGQPVKDLVPLKPDFTLFKPNPENMQNWVDTGLVQNLELQSAKLQVEADELGVEINQAGFLPTLAVNGNYGYGHSNAPGANPSSSYTRNVGVAVSYNLLNGGATVASVQQSRYTEQADQAAADNQYRQTVSTVRQDYLKVLSDISQIQAYKQAVISGESSLAAAQAAYQVGTKTLVDLLTQQSALYQYQQSYVAGVQNYITDSLQLKLDTGILTANDLSMINQWLLSAPVTVAMKTTVSS